MKPLYTVLIARLKDRPASHWVVFQTKISGVPLIAVAYAGSQRGVSYMLSMCGSTEPAEKMYVSYFEDAYSNVSSRTSVTLNLHIFFLITFLSLTSTINSTNKFLVLRKNDQQGTAGFIFLLLLLGCMWLIYIMFIDI